MFILRREYGKVAKVGGLIGHPDLLFVFDGDEIRNIFKKEEVLPHRPSMPSLAHYKSHLQKDFFGETAGVIGVHGERWDKFRAQVQQVMLQPQTARKYVGPLNEIATDFMERVHNIRDENNELPGDFLGELYKWALECNLIFCLFLFCQTPHFLINLFSWDFLFFSNWKGVIGYASRVYYR